AILQLKSDTEAAASLIRGSNERRSAERARKDAAHEAEREQLAAKGLNPYKVFKQRDVDRRAVQEETRQENAIRRRKEVGHVPPYFLRGDHIDAPNGR
ncbi:unnamed protein product, partial [Sphacelaria rigidula]